MSQVSSPTEVLVDPVQQRRFLEGEERKTFTLMHSTMTSLAADPRSQEEDFLTPSHSPYSTDSNYSTNADPGYFSPHHHHHHDLALDQPMPFPPVSATTQQFITPGSPCNNETLVGYSCPSPYSSPYNSPQSINTPLQVSLSSPQPHHQSMELLANTHMVPDGSNYYTESSIAASIAASMSMAAPYGNEGVITTSTSKCSNQQMFYQTWNPNFSADAFLTPSNNGGILQAPTHQNQLMEGEVSIKVYQQDIDYYPLTPESSDNGHAYGPDITTCYPPTTAAHMCQPFPGVHTKSNRVQPKTKRIKNPKPAVQVDDSGIKDIPTSAQLWEFTLRVLKKPMYHYMINWDIQKDGLFRFHDAQAFAALWGKHRNRPNMTYDKVARALRYYYKRDILNQVGGRLTYKFSKRLGKLYSSESST